VKVKNISVLMAIFIFAILLPMNSSASSSGGSTTHVRGYVKKSGKYVAPHQRTKPNKTKSDNWSNKGNVNPYTGKPGSKN